MSTNAPDLPLPDEEEDGPYALVGSARAKDGLVDALETRLLSMVAPTRQEPGVLQYHVHRDRADPSRLVFYEVWRSVDDLREHFVQPHVISFLKERHAYLNGDLDITWLRMASPYPAVQS
jgi:quinol monooxygenase YgiN